MNSRRGPDDPMQTPEPAAVTRALEEVYARAEFTHTPPPWPLQLLADLRDAFFQLLAGFLDWLASTLVQAVPEGWTPILGRIALVLLVAAAVVALGYILAGAGRQRRGVDDPGLNGDRDLTSPGPAHNATGWDAVAEEAAREGRFRDAALALYRGVLLRMQERGALRITETKTPGDYRREVRSQPDAEAGFEAFLRFFLPLAFGSRSDDPGAFSRLVETAAPLGSRLRWPPSPLHRERQGG